MKKLVGLTLAFVAAFAAPAAADVYDDNPATASRGGSDLWVFARASNGETLEKHVTSTGWTGWNSLGGSSASGPAAVNVGSAIHVYITATNGAVYENIYDGSSWRGWNSLGGVATSAPSVTVRRGSPAYIDLAVRGTDNAIWHRSYIPGTGWSAFGSIGGVLTSAPSLNSQNDGLLNIWARGTDGAVKQKSWTGTEWVEWFDLGGGIVGAPTSVSRMPDHINVYVRGAGDQTYQRNWTPAGWSGYFVLDSTPLSSSPVAGSSGPDREWIVARRENGIGLKQWSAANGWGSWLSLGEPVKEAPPVPAGPPASAALPDGSVGIETGVRCTPVNGLLRVNVAVRKPKGGKKARVTKIVFFTKGKGHRTRVDRKAPYQVRIRINRPAGSKGRVYARIYYRRSAKGKLHKKTVSRRYTVCR